MQAQAPSSPLTTRPLPGYRHIDTATIYGNETEVGIGIKASGVPREEIFVTTKLPNTHHRKVKEALDESLQKLGTGYLDLCKWFLTLALLLQ